MDKTVIVVRKATGGYSVRASDGITIGPEIAHFNTADETHSYLASNDYKLVERFGAPVSGQYVKAGARYA